MKKLVVITVLVLLSSVAFFSVSTHFNAKKEANPKEKDSALTVTYYDLEPIASPTLVQVMKNSATQETAKLTKNLTSFDSSGHKDEIYYVAPDTLTEHSSFLKSPNKKNSVDIDRGNGVTENSITDYDVDFDAKKEGKYYYYVPLFVETSKKNQLTSFDIVNHQVNTTYHADPSLSEERSVQGVYTEYLVGFEIPYDEVKNHLLDITLQLTIGNDLLTQSVKSKA
ncbi:hypothetical protein [Vagococcus fessus]|uniref:Gram-positive pilin subunit D1 N-terminal domain-containing protein n=1 Tax=Vagococcus fessus TaxID=120370 RepID=A0A430ABZ0_9ENTE|nr:hypothetical protein [Vagococcus fessus]RSU04712.1 hypothetical protein CBF31_01460 [Vagococcus fessus]